MEQSPISGVGGWDSTQGTVEPTQDTSVSVDSLI